MHGAITVRCDICRANHTHTWDYTGEEGTQRHRRWPHCATPGNYPHGYYIQDRAHRVRVEVTPSEVAPGAVHPVPTASPPVSVRPEDYSGVPVLYGEVERDADTGGTTIAVWCSHCQEQHDHLWWGDGDVHGRWRSASCQNADQYPHGYVIQLDLGGRRRQHRESLQAEAQERIQERTQEMEQSEIIFAIDVVEALQDQHISSAYHDNILTISVRHNDAVVVPDILLTGEDFADIQPALHAIAVKVLERKKAQLLAATAKTVANIDAVLPADAIKNDRDIQLEE